MNPKIENYLKRDSVKIIVKPNSKKTEIIDYDESKDALIVNVGAPPDKGKANLEIVKFFTRLTKKKVVIKSGHSSKIKILRIH